MTATRSTRVILSAEVDQFIADMVKAGHAAADVATQVRTAAQKASVAQRTAAKEAKQAADEQSVAARRGKDAFDQTAQSATRGALAVVAGLGLSAKAAVDWESEWTGVAKTVDGTQSQMAGLEGQLRQMARTLPESHDEIAAVAEAAGQLGVETGDVAGFTEVMVKLGETTNLTADQAATEIAQISNVMGTMARDGVDGAARFGSALVALGNDGASTEADILSMASRIAGAAKVVGMTEGDLLGVSNALASVGIEAEAGGTALSNVLIDMSKAVATGSDDLQGFADVAKMSADGFSTAFKDRPAAAVAAFTQGLARIQASGGDVFTTLSDLGQSDVRVTSALLKMAGAGTLFSDSLDLGAKAITNTNALNAEFAKRLDTTASKIQIARNNVRDAAITIGTSLAPAISTAAEGTAKVAQLLAAIPAPMRNVGLAVAGVGSAGVLAAAGIAKVVDVGKKAGDALAYIAQRGPRAAAAVEKVKGSAVGLSKVMGVAVVAGTIGGMLLDKGSSYRGVDKLTSDILASTDAISVWDQEIAKATSSIGLFHDESVNSLSEVFDAAFSPSAAQHISSGLSAALKTISLGTLDNATAIGQANDALRQMDEVLASLQARDPKLATEQFRQLATYAEQNGFSLDQLMDKLPQYENAVAAAGNATQAAGTKSSAAAAGAATMGDALKTSTRSAEDAANALDGLVGTLESLGSTLRDQRGSARDFQAAIDDATQSVQDNGRSLDITTEAGRANQSALDDIASATADWAAKSAQAGASQGKVTSILDAGRASFIRAAESMGMTAKEAARLADQMGLVPKDVATRFEAIGAPQAKQAAADIKAEYDRLPSSMPTTFLVVGTETARSEAKLTGIAYDRVPTSHETAFSTPGSVQSRIQSQIVESAIRGIPRSWSSVISTSGADAAAAAAWRVRDAMYSIPRQVHGTIVIDRISHNQTVNERGGLHVDGVKAYAGGGISLATGAPVARVPQIVRGGANVLWGEKATGWEAYISGIPSHRGRNLRIWADAGRLLGVPAWVMDLARAQKAYAAGGVAGRYSSQSAYDAVSIR